LVWYDELNVTIDCIGIEFQKLSNKITNIYNDLHNLTRCTDHRYDPKILKTFAIMLIINSLKQPFRIKKLPGQAKYCCRFEQSNK